MADLPRRAAALVIFRRRAAQAANSNDSGELEVFIAARSAKLRFLGGYLAFPGGVVEAGDGSLPMAPEVSAGEAERELLGCAARELFEETGLFLARGADGALPGAGALAELRAALLERGTPAARFGEFLRLEDLALDVGRLVPLTRIVTPRFSALRYDTSFFLVEAPGEPVIVPGELDWGAWRRPADILASWRQGEVRVASPVLVILEALAAAPLAAALETLRAIPPEFEDSNRAVLCAPGYVAVPLETPPLPPAIPTNSFLVGDGDFIVVDPAPKPARGQERLFAVVDARRALGHRLRAVVLTHHHPDHVGALAAAVARYGAPVWAHRRTGELLGQKLDRQLADGDEIPLGLGPDGRSGWALRVIYTPGHAEDHIVLHDERSRSLIAGDLLSTLVSMYVGSPGGSLRQYFASLERIRELPLETIYPSHGVPSHEPKKLIDETLRHRKKRLEEIHARLGKEPRETASLAEEVYPEAITQLRPLIVRATRAALEYLEEEGRAVKVGSDAFARSP